MPRKIRVLLVDDETDFTAVLSRRLDRLGMTVATAQDGDEAYMVLDAARYQVVVLDMQMPGLDGLQVLKVIRQNFPNVAVVMLTGNGLVADAIRSLKAGAFDYLHKPVPTEDLAEVIQRAAVGTRAAGKTRRRKPTVHHPEL